jgi:murein L,D-transpeptidase YcbB/YkuD
MENRFKLKNHLKILPLCLLFLWSCADDAKHVGEAEIVSKPSEINVHAGEIIKQSLKDILNDPHFRDSFRLKNVPVVDTLYDANQFELFWSSEGRFSRSADSMVAFIREARMYGLFPSDYYENQLELLQLELARDTTPQLKLDASKWALSDLLFTSAFVQIVKDLKVGRILPDSVIQRDTSLRSAFFLQEMNRFQVSSLADFATMLEPKHSGYLALKASMKPFLDSTDFTIYTYVQAWDSSTLKQLIYQRLGEEDSTQIAGGTADSAVLSNAIKKYQQKKNITADGRISNALINMLNDTGRERFIRIAITLDRYKLLPRLPEQYIWVNIPTYYLQVREKDSVVLTSKIVVGKTYTKTPELTSAISDMITYPQWTIPESIIAKEILPGLKKDPGYTSKKGYSILDKDGIEVDPYFVDWSKYKKMIPYKVIQGSGDANALGVIKFNFPNKHAVYLHDTNQRYLFARKTRALSHGCVRVESWRALAHYILKSDSLATSNVLPVDTLHKWLSLKEKHVIPVRRRIPLFIRYFTCENKAGNLVFHEDIYGEDRKLRDQYFARK